MSKAAAMEQHKKEVAVMRSWLIAKGYHKAAAALEFARKFHDGIRKDGISPEFSHQMFIANYLRTILPGVTYPEETLATAFLHDVCEDANIGFDEIEKKFGSKVAESVKLLTKKHRGAKIPYETYFANMAEDPIASLVKAADRAHNIFSMAAARWSIEKQAAYLEEVDKWFLPMVKAARRSFTEQEQAYHNVKTLLSVQCKLIRLNLEQAQELKELQSADSPENPGEVSTQRRP
jgi:(p)ppGpp synthase/HD superfamily hydrolase